MKIHIPDKISSQRITWIKHISHISGLDTYGEIWWNHLFHLGADARPNDPTSPMARWVMERPPPAQMMEELQPMMKAKLLQLFGHRMYFLGFSKGDTKGDGLWGASPLSEGLWSLLWHVLFSIGSMYHFTNLHTCNFCWKWASPLIHLTA